MARRRSGSYWVIGAGVVVVLAVGLVGGADAGAFALAAVLAAAAVARGFLPEPRPEALVVRRRWVDVTMLGTLAVVLAILAAVLPTYSP
ncbi:MAG: DUF3017 domain-containing protein [Micrococcales bacterium]|nr:DUF3017 domain-containing protein [Micrococcales bacterium]